MVSLCDHSGRSNPDVTTHRPPEHISIELGCHTVLHLGLQNTRVEPDCDQRRVHCDLRRGHLSKLEPHQIRPHGRSSPQHGITNRAPTTRSRRSLRRKFFGNACSSTPLLVRATRDSNFWHPSHCTVLITINAPLWLLLSVYSDHLG